MSCLKMIKAIHLLRLTAEKHPRLIITRKVKKDKGKYFGPYPNVKQQMKQKNCLIEFIHYENAQPCQTGFACIIISGNVWHHVSMK